MQHDTYHEEWLRPENWRYGWLGIYVAPDDPRVWVPKQRPAFGWTLNFAHRVSYAYLLLLLAPTAVLLATTVWVVLSR